MKKVLFLYLFLIVTLSIKAQVDYSQKVDFNLKQISIENFINKIEVEYKVSFVYGDITTTTKADLNFRGSLKEALNIYFSEVSLKFKIINNHIILKKSLLKKINGSIVGKIIDSDTKASIVGASFIVLNYTPFTGTSSNIDGRFSLDELPIGRYDFIIKSLGYESKVLNQKTLISAKTLFLEIQLDTKFSKLDEIVVLASHNKYDASNSMAMSSSRNFSVEETQRYAASISDPARMAQNYAGVTFGDDLNNDVVVRGNSPRGLLWRLEGVEIPNPNHYTSLGSQGGGVSIMNSATLNNSDFYTSSFPAQFGNAISGVFDLKLRKGNSEKREHSFKIGILGIEASTEGFFSKKSNASYLINYRSSSTFLLKPIVPILKDQNLFFHDVSFKVFVPTNKMGSFTLFGLGGLNTDFQNGENDRSKWKRSLYRIRYKENQDMGVLGLNHKIVLSKKSYLDSHFAFTAENQLSSLGILDSIPTKPTNQLLFRDFKTYNYILSTTLNHKFSSKNLLQIGVINTKRYYNYFFYAKNNNVNRIYFSDKGNTTFFQSFLQWKHKFSDNLIANSGIHFSYLFLNKTYAIDPRFGLEYKINRNHALSLFIGIHSKPEHISTYLIENIRNNSQPNFNLQMTKALHNVLSYQFIFAKDFNFKTELYYQYLFDVPVLKNAVLSSLIAENVYDLISLDKLYGVEYTNKGTGQNFGVDLTLEKYFSNKYYAMFTASVFDSYFTTYSGEKYRTPFAKNYLLNIVGGKEFIVGKNKNNTISLNGKFIFNGGNRYTPIDVERSIKENYNYYAIKNAYFTKQFQPYYRFDLGFKYKINTKKTTHTIMIDIQNVTNHRNIEGVDFNTKTNSIEKYYQIGIIPFVSYKIDFSL